MKVVLLSTTAMAALLSGLADAHGKILKPAATYRPGGNSDSFNALIDSSKLPAPFAGKKYNNNPKQNADAFTSAFSASSYKTLKDLADEYARDCGRTTTTGAAVDVGGLRDLEWGNKEAKQGFVSSHSGPCEIWIDTTKVFADGNCVATFGSGFPARIPVDYSVCKGKCQLTFYWLALHEPEWQVYKQCVMIQNGAAAGGGGAGGNSTSPIPMSSTPAVGTSFGFEVVKKGEGSTSDSAEMDEKKKKKKHDKKKEDKHTNKNQKKDKDDGSDSDDDENNKEQNKKHKKKHDKNKKDKEEEN